MCGSCLLIVYVEAFINVLFLALTIAIFGRVILSWIPTRLPWGLNDFIFAVTEPILAPIRRALPAAAGMDFSPLIALVLLQLVEQLLLRVLPPTL
ncbi:MAG TPA: YggT family protein [Candidatus Limnocylindria bacterium]|nr:YggT family protein [Candidatus Limnocylindria bacterium]